MKKPDWFELTDNDDNGLRIVNKIPYFVFVIIGILVAGIVFMFPSYNSQKNPNPAPTAEVISETPIVSPSTIIMPNGEDDDDRDEEDDD